MLDTALSLALDRGDEIRTPPVVVSACSVALQKIRTALPDLGSIGVTSALPGEGRSTIAAGLAVANAIESSRRTVLVDLAVDCEDLPRLDAAPGESDPAGVAQLIEWVTADLGVLPSARWVTGRGATRSAVDDLLRECGELDALVIADLPALPPHGCGDRFAASCDAVVQVIRTGSTDVADAVAGSAALARPPYVVLNQMATAVPRWVPGAGRR